MLNQCYCSASGNRRLKFFAVKWNFINRRYLKFGQKLKGDSQNKGKDSVKT